MSICCNSANVIVLSNYRYALFPNFGHFKFKLTVNCIKTNLINALINNTKNCSFPSKST